LLREKENNKTQNFSLLSSVQLICPQNPKRTPHNPLPLLKNWSSGVKKISEHGAMPKSFKTSQQNAFKRGGPTFPWNSLAIPEKDTCAQGLAFPRACQELPTETAKQKTKKPKRLFWHIPDATMFYKQEST
jgi:hypothetical protein